MIVIDENLHDRRILASIEAWMPGQVVSVTTLRPGSIIKDDAIPSLLCQVAYPTFVTINVTDFWRKVEPNSGYCIVAIALPKERVREIPELLHRLFHHPELRTKATRMGKVILVAMGRIEYYESDRQIKPMPWSELG